MSKIENPEDEDLLKKNDSESEDEDDTEDEDLDESDESSEDGDEEDEDSEESKSKSKDYRGKLNAQNRFLIKEGYENVNGKWIKPEKPDTKKIDKKSPVKPQGISTMDVLVLVNAKVPQEDIEDVTEYATFKKISIKEALETNFVKSLLSDKLEQRIISDATHTGSARRSSSKKNSTAILEDASKGNLPDDPSELTNARLAKRLKDKDIRKRR